MLIRACVLLFLVAATAQAGVALRTRLWEPGTTLRINFSAEQLMPGELECIRTTLAEIEAVIPLRFRLATNRYYLVNPPHAIVFVNRHTGAREEGGFSHVGDEAGRRETMMLRLQAPAGERLTEYECSRNRNTILHEFGHLLGLMHEHQHPDAPAGVREAVFRTNAVGLREDQVAHNIGPFDPSLNVVTQPYDIASIMHYPFEVSPGLAYNISQAVPNPWFRAHGRQPGEASLHLPGERNWRTIYMRERFTTDRLSEGDVRMLQALYGRP